VREPPKTKVVIATRGSALALWQADHVTGLLAARGVAAEKLVLKTTADRVQDRFLHELGGKGLFIKELEEALLDGRADLAVHSLKDMPATVPAGFALAAVLPRHSPADVLIFRQDVAARLKPSAVLGEAAVRALPPLQIGTGSLRRQAILRRVAPALTTVGVRGNVDTRLKKLAGGEWDALILAEASLDRLGVTDVARCRLAPDWFIPCASQGALALEAKAGSPVAAWLKGFEDEATRLAVDIERGVLAGLGGDCTLPFGCLVAREGAMLVARAGVYGPSGEAALAEHRASVTPVVDREAFATAILARLKAAGVVQVLAALGLEAPSGFD
jgi:hydroxymethylbilane synthase